MFLFRHFGLLFIFLLFFNKKLAIIRSGEEKSLHSFEDEAFFRNGIEEDAENDYKDFEDTAEISDEVN